LALADAKPTRATPYLEAALTRIVYLAMAGSWAASFLVAVRRMERAFRSRSPKRSKRRSRLAGIDAIADAAVAP
jgi:hypothetical protein